MGRQAKNSRAYVGTASRLSGDETLARTALNVPDPGREARISRLEESVRAGTYDLDAGRIALGLLEEARARLLEESITVRRATAQKTIIWLTEMEETLRAREDTDGANEVAAVRDDIFRSWRSGTCI